MPDSDRRSTITSKMENAILVGTHALDELRELAISAGARIIDEVIQRRDRPDPATFIGKGKVEELREASASRRRGCRHFR